MSLGTLRLIDDPPASGAWNMAVDEALARHVVDEPCLRFYRWTPATLSLGFFQKLADREQHAASLLAPVVRRASGGGAIVHDRELTYSLAVPARHPLARDPLALYRNLHAALVAVLSEWRVAAQLCPADLTPLGEKPFLCFERRSEGDVLLDRYKICGSAQRRHRDAVLQHGSVLLARSPAAPELPGIAELSGQIVDAAALAAAWVEQLAGSWQFTVRTDGLSSDEKTTAIRCQREQFDCEDWTARR